MSLRVLVLLACIAASPPTALLAQDSSGWSFDDARVLFERRGPEASVLLVLDRSTGDTVALTLGPAREWSGRISPDGRRLAFIGSVEGNYEVYLRDLSGGDVRNLSSHPEYDIVGAWSPDGKDFAFMSTRGYELGGADGPFPGHIWIVGTDGSGLRPVTREPLTSSLGPTDWSPDGRHLLLARRVEGQIDVFLLDVEDGSERRVTRDPADEYGATFSSDGTRIAFHAEDDGVSRIVVADLDGGNRREVGQGMRVDYAPRWSPDDRWLLVSRRGPATDGEQYDVIALSVEDGTVVPLVTTQADERAGDWLPGRR